MLRYPPEDEQVKQPIDYILRGNLSLNIDSQAFPGIFVNDIEHPERFSVRRPGHYEIIAPNVILMLWTESDTGAVIEP
jgi:hypothetical protein